MDFRGTSDRRDRSDVPGETGKKGGRRQIVNALIIGSGIAGMTCAARCARNGVHATLVSPVLSERSQAVMAAGGI
ncbi:MAG: FAD-binding protein, partial [Lachnospiraceae bacterium]|nr:FAD-binding protein [Lachnospiraceae bacterium]